MAKLILILFVTLLGFDARAQSPEFSPSAHTAVAETARYEIVQSPLMAKWTFRLDRYTGIVYQLVKTRADRFAWEEMIIVDLPKSFKDFKARYQIFASGILVKNTFLINLETGQTWVLTTFTNDKKEELNGWAPFEL